MRGRGRAGREGGSHNDHHSCISAPVSYPFTLPLAHLSCCTQNSVLVWREGQRSSSVNAGEMEVNLTMPAFPVSLRALPYILNKAQCRREAFALHTWKQENKGKYLEYTSHTWKLYPSTLLFLPPSLFFP